MFENELIFFVKIDEGIYKFFVRDNKQCLDSCTDVHLYYYDEESGEMIRIRLKIKKGSDTDDPVQYWEMIDEEGNLVGILAEKENSARVL